MKSPIFNSNIFGLKRKEVIIMNESNIMTF